MVSVRVLRGHGVSVSRDTIRMLVTRGSDADWEPLPPGSIAFVKLEHGTLIETVTFDQKKTAHTLVGIVGVAAAIAYLFALVAPFLAST
jgi:hypothetical protein